MLTEEEKNRREELLIEATRNLDPAEPIDTSDPRYVDCASVRGDEGLLVKKIDEAILRAYKAGSKPKTYLFSGHTGSGKSTELKSLEKSLTEKRLFTIKIDALETIDTEDPNYIDILFSIASEIERQMRKSKMPLPKKLMDSIKEWFDETIYERTTENCKNAELGTNVKTGVKVPLFAELFATLMGQLKYSSNERKTIRRKLEPTISRLMTHINNMVGEAERILKKKKFLGLIIIYDNLEKIKLSYPESYEIEGRSTHEIIFLDNSNHLSGIRCHKIYTVPLSLLYSVNHTRLVQLYNEAYVLPMIKVCRTRSREINKEGIDLFYQVAEKRMDIDSLFEDKKLVEDIALFSGGNVREFIRMLSYLVEAAPPEALPLTHKDVQFTFRRIIRDYETSPSDEDFLLLARVYNDFNISNDRAHYRMLYNHFILAYVNDQTWYDVHPAVREVRKFKAALQELERQKKSNTLK